MCGKLDPHYESTRPDDAYSAVFCNEHCAKQYWETHAGPKTGCWTHAAKCLMLSRLFTHCNAPPAPAGPKPIGDAIGEQPQAETAPSPANGDAETFRKYFDALALLKTRLETLHDALGEVKGSDPQTTAVTRWIDGFDALMRDLDVLYAQDFNDQFVQRVLDLQKLHEKCSQHGSLSRSLGEIKSILSMLVRRMPLNRDLYNNREVLKRLLGMNRYCQEKLILTLDGGGT
jgi:hypothetical protein